MSMHIDPNDPRYKQAAAEILRRHDKGEPEANITSAVRNFLTVTGLVKAEHIVEENPPAEGSRRAVDLTDPDTFISEPELPTLPARRAAQWVKGLVAMKEQTHGQR